MAERSTRFCQDACGAVYVARKEGENPLSGPFPNSIYCWSSLQCDSLRGDWDSCGDSAIQLAGKVIRRSFVTNKPFTVHTSKHPTLDLADLLDRWNALKLEVDSKLDDCLQKRTADCPDRLREAMRYSLLAPNPFAAMHVERVVPSI